VLSSSLGNSSDPHIDGLPKRLSRASGRIAHRVAAADEEGERRREAKMKKQMNKVAEIGSAATKPVRKSVRDIVEESRMKAFAEKDEMKDFFTVRVHKSADLPKALFAVDYLTNYYLSRNEEEMTGNLANGFAEMIRSCALEAFELVAQRDTLEKLVCELEEQLELR
jgi:hypothetical protein